MTNTPSSFPDAQDFAAAAAILFNKRGQQQEVELLVNSEIEMDFLGTRSAKEGERGVDGGFEGYDFTMRLKIDVYEQIATNKSKYEKSLQIQLNELSMPYGVEIATVTLIPIIQVQENWRENFNTLSQSVFGLPPRHSKYESDIFMLMPFQDPSLEEVFRDHIVSIASLEGKSIKRGDDFFSKHSVITDIWAAINGAKLIIAECTGRNPNVFYELGIAHTIGKPTITITQNEADIPFDIRHWRYIKYDFTPRGMAKFEQNLHSAIKEMLSDIESDPNDIHDSIGKADSEN